MAEQTVANLDRRAFLKTGAAGAAGLAASATLAGCASEKLSQPKTKPNILFVITDQQHYDTIAATGCKHVRTPALDRLVTTGTVFQQSYCPYPLCSPSRAATFTGRTASETAVYKNEISIREDFPTLGEWFRKESDYETIYAGKWHLPATYTTDIPGFTVPMTGLIGQGNFCDTGVAMACDAYIRNRSKDKPFLMVASFMQPHDICEWLRLNLKDQPDLRYPEIADELPELPPSFDFAGNEPAAVLRQRKNDEPGRGGWSRDHWRYYMWSYYRHIEMVDAEIGRMIQALEDTGQAENTVVIFTADHGEGMGRHKMVRKSTMYDEASKVPLTISWPGELPIGNNASLPVSGLDLFPTMCDFAGIAPPPGMRGSSLRPAIEGVSEPERDFIATECANNMGQMIRSGRFKYIAYKNDPVEQLFDMVNDPDETRNLADVSEFASDLDNHRTMLKDWIGQLDVAPTVPGENRWFIG